jgi:isopentenyl-diphosphate delta-isomerase
MQKESNEDAALPEMIYTVDESGKLLVLEPREKLHLATTSRRHAAVIGMILRKDGTFLVQWRAANKLGGSRLDVSATTHVREDETYERALQRSFENELRVNSVIPLKHAFDFKYEEELGSHKENEYCKVYVGYYDGEFLPNPEEIDSLEFMKISELKDFVKNNEIKATKWLRETVRRMDESLI